MTRLDLTSSATGGKTGEAISAKVKVPVPVSAAITTGTHTVGGGYAEALSTIGGITATSDTRKEGCTKLITTSTEAAKGPAMPLERGPFKRGRIWVTG